MYHHLQCFYRVFSLCSLSGQHHCICSVINSICNVCHFRSCRTWITDHGIQHLSCCNNSLEVIITLLNQHLLQVWHFLCRNLNTHISSCYHDTICSTDNLINIANSFCILNLRNDRNIRCIQFFQKCADLKDALCIAHKGCSDKINILFYTKFDVFFIFFCDCRKSYRNVRYIDPFSLTKLTAVYDLTNNILIYDFFYFQSDQTVIDQNYCSLLYIFCKTFIRKRHFCIISYDIFHCKYKCIPFLEGYFLSVFQKTCTDFRSLCVQKNRCVRMFFLAKLFQKIHTEFLLFVITV